MDTAQPAQLLIHLQGQIALTLETSTSSDQQDCPVEVGLHIQRSSLGEVTVTQGMDIQSGSRQCEPCPLQGPLASAVLRLLEQCGMGGGQWTVLSIRNHGFEVSDIEKLLDEHEKAQRER